MVLAIIVILMTHGNLYWLKLKKIKTSVSQWHKLILNASNPCSGYCIGEI